MGKPGVMIYFGDAEALAPLSDADRGRMFQAIVDYSRDGVLPDFSAPQDTGLAGLWVVFKKAVDADSDRYTKVSLQKKYARYCGIQRANGDIPMEFNDWLNHQGVLTDVNDRQRPSTTDQREPTETTNNQLPISNNQFPNTNSQFQIPNILSKKEEKEERKIEQQMKAEYEAAFGGGPSDLEEWNYLIRTYGADTARRAMQEAKEKGMTQYAAWLFVTTRIKFPEDE